MKRARGPSDRPGRLSRSELSLTLAAPAARDGFVSRWLLVDGLPTHFRTGGPEHTHPVVLLHGLAVSHRYLMPTARALARGNRVYVPDLPGFGFSEKPARVYGVTEHARHVAAFIAELGLPPACLLGNSFGAQVAAACAANHPSAVSALVLVGPTTDRVARSRTGQIARWLLDVPREDPRQARFLVRDVWEAGARRVFGTLGHSVRDRIEEWLRQVDVPVLLIRGARDSVAPPRWLDELAELYPGTQIATVPGAAHNAVTTAGEQVAELTRRFIARRGSPRR